MCSSRMHEHKQHIISGLTCPYFKLSSWVLKSLVKKELFYTNDWNKKEDSFFLPCHGLKIFFKIQEIMRAEQNTVDPLF